QDPARQLGLSLHSLEVRNVGELDKAFEIATNARADALTILPEPVFVANLKRIADFAAKNHLPSIFHLREFADAGGLITYGPDRSDLFRRAAAYIDKILKGAKPADLPIQLPTKFELVVNLKTAKAIGLELPPTLIARADEVTEKTRERGGLKMNFPRRNFLHLAAGAAALPVLSRIARAQAYPTRPVRIFVGFPAGSGIDRDAHIVGEWLAARLGQSFDVENRLGAGTYIATEAVVRAPPDGYTLLLANTANAINATLYDRLNFNFVRDITPVAG